MSILEKLFGVSVPKALITEDDFRKLDNALTSGSLNKKRKALKVAEEAGSAAARVTPKLEPLLDAPGLQIEAARALWQVMRHPKALEHVRRALDQCKTQHDALLALALMANTEPQASTELLCRTEPFLDVLTTSSGRSDKDARYAAAALAQAAFDHEAVKRRLANAVVKPKNPQQKKYAALALGFSLSSDRKKMEEGLGFMNAFFDSPDIAMIAARNKIRDTHLEAGMRAAPALAQN